MHDEPIDGGISFMDNLLELAQQQILSSARVKNDLAQTHGEQITALSLAIARAFYLGNKVLICGNGGSASDSQHIAAEFVGRFRRERLALPSIALTANGATLTAIGNDYSYEMVFERQVRALGKKGDVFIGLTTSGTSPNVVTAAKAARDLGLTTVALTGGKPSPLSDICDIHFAIPTPVTARVQEAHMLICHVACELVDEILFPQNSSSSYDLMSAPQPPKQASLSELIRVRADWRKLGLKVVWTNGCFDLLHAGHLKNLKAAKALGDILIVGINSDASVSQIKGDGRPILSENDRAELVCALDCVDHAVIFNDKEPSRILGLLQPDVHTKGSEYAGGARPMPERDVVLGYGGTIEYLPLVPGYSTTSLIERIASSVSAELTSETEGAVAAASR